MSRTLPLSPPRIELSYRNRESYHNNDNNEHDEFDELVSIRFTTPPRYSKNNNYNNILHSKEQDHSVLISDDRNRRCSSRSDKNSKEQQKKKTSSSTSYKKTFMSFFQKCTSPLTSKNQKEKFFEKITATEQYPVGTRRESIEEEEEEDQTVSTFHTPLNHNKSNSGRNRSIIFQEMKQHKASGTPTTVIMHYSDDEEDKEEDMSPNTNESKRTYHHDEPQSPPCHITLAPSYTTATSMSFQDDKMHDYESDYNHYPRHILKNNNSRFTTAFKQQREIQKWKDYLAECMRNNLNGGYSIETVDCMYQLSQVYARHECHEEALEILKNVVRIRRSIFGDRHLSVALTLNAVGKTAAYAAKDNKNNADSSKAGALDWALLALYEALEIRCEELGPWHLDTADTLNNIAGVYYRKDELKLAEEAYKEVISVRAAVFGKNHPSVAVTFTTLGRIQLRQRSLDDAFLSFNSALNIYRVGMNLNQNSKLVTRLLKYISRVERLRLSMPN